MKKNWVWCEHCMEYVDLGEKTSLRSFWADKYNKNWATFECDECDKEASSIVIDASTKPKTY